MEKVAKFDPGLFDHLIDAEREALVRAEQKVGKIALIKALRQATGLSLSEANQAVTVYLAHRGGRISTRIDHARPANWIDDLLDAERASASREDRPITKILLIKALRDASGLGLRDAKQAVEEYLGRRGGNDLPTGSARISLVGLTILAGAIAGAIAWFNR